MFTWGLHFLIFPHFSWKLIWKVNLWSPDWSLMLMPVKSRRAFIVMHQKLLQRIRIEGKGKVHKERNWKSSHHKLPFQLDIHCSKLQKKRWALELTCYNILNLSAFNWTSSSYLKLFLVFALSFMLRILQVATQDYIFGIKGTYCFLQIANLRVPLVEAFKMPLFLLQQWKRTNSRESSAISTFCFKESWT